VKVGSEVRIEVITKNVSDHDIDLPRSPRLDLGEQGNDVEVTDEKGAAVPETKDYRVLRGKDTYDDVPRPDGKFVPMMADGATLRRCLASAKPTSSGRAQSIPPVPPCM
jgi:hypothetical protein